MTGADRKPSSERPRDEGSGRWPATERLVEGQPHLFYHLDGTARLRCWNGQFVEATGYDEADLAGRELDRPIQTAQEFSEEVADRLTDRQLEALKTAFYSGYFAWPRENTGQEVAAMLDISQPTFNRHLREGQRQLLDLLLE